MAIDFVITWVNGNDKNWLKVKNSFLPPQNTDSRINRYRDLDILQYWFRGVELFTPWVRKIHFVTWGHLPEWLNVNNSKINIVKHSEFIPSEFLPTFNSNAIELNLHRIKELSECFVYFNDDMFIIRDMKEKDFFINGLPCDSAVLDIIPPTGLFSHILVNNIIVVNKYFDKRKTIRKNYNKWFRLKYGRDLFRTLLLLPWAKFSGIKNYHLPIPFKKSTFYELWQKENGLMRNTCLNKFRSSSDINIWLFRYWQLLKGDFIPSKVKGRHYNIESIYDIEKVKKGFSNPNCKMICLNDNINAHDFEEVKKALKNIFEKILPNKSSFEI